AEPPEARGLARDEVRLMVSHLAANRIEHTRFRQIGDFLEAGDLLVINTSGTRNAALDVVAEDGSALELHLSTQLPAGLWIVELRTPGEAGTQPFYTAKAGMRLRLPEGATATLHVPYLHDYDLPANAHHRLWIATLQLPDAVDDYLMRCGFPIRYGYVRQGW